MTLGSDNLFPKLKMAEGTAWATPASGEGVFYVKTDGLPYFKNDAGSEYDLTSSTTSLVIYDEGSVKGTATLGLNLVGSGVSGTVTSGTAIVTVSSGSSAASGARVYNDANISLTNGSLTLLTFNTERYDDAAYHDTGSNTGRLTVPSAGRYLVGGHVQTTAASGDPSYVAIRVSGTTFIAVQNILASAGEVYTSISTIWDCTAGTEYFELGVMVNASSKNAIAASAFSPEFWIERLGDT